MEEQKKKGILTRSKRKLEMDDVPIAYMEEQKKKKNENLTLGKRKIEMDGGPIASNKRWKLTAHRTATAESPHQKLPHECMVFTLGSISWRESSTPTTLPVIAVSAGIIQEKMKKKVILSRMSFSRSAIYVGGALYWRVLTRDQGFGDNKEEDQETEMLLCFDIHNEQFQLISLPLECSLKIKTGTTTITTEQEQQLIDHRLLEFEGSPCIARLQTGEQRNNGNCCCKVHLYVLKDRVNSEWSAEIFDVCDNTSMIQDMSNPPPCIIATATSSTTATTTTVTTTITVAAAAATTTATTTTSTTTHAPQPITQIMCASDRVILYWFDNVCVQLYDLRRKRLKMVKYSPVDPTKEVELFSCKVRRRVFLIDDVVDVDKLIYCRRDHIGYKLHSYVENSLPLKIFIPKECTILRDYMNWLLENKDIEDGLGYVYTDGKNRTPEFHCFCKRLSKEGSR
ncbi:uncharacterized protein LOC113321722 [Papaver somniferum]|uniref:uncharacterized protein LOC113321722 n=1 Tax=Papaver somniferum TaxID=3469 RepID=UPI000E6F78DC|nr:uncharacterized protein LOC113321722 [Papaver somniferum]